MVNSIEPDKSRLKTPNSAVYERMLKELQFSDGEVRNIWKVAGWMMANIYDPNTRERLMRLKSIINGEMKQLQDNTEAAKTVLNEEIDAWVSDIDQSKDDFEKDLAAMRRRAGLK